MAAMQGDFDEEMMGGGMEELLLMGGGGQTGGLNKEFIQKILVDTKPGQFYNSWGSTFDEGDMKPLEKK